MSAKKSFSTETSERYSRALFEVAKEAGDLEKIEKLNNLQILGPVDSPIFRRKKKYRTRLLVRSESRNMCQKQLSRVLENLKISSKIKLTVDVDPVNFG